MNGTWGLILQICGGLVVVGGGLAVIVGGGKWMVGTLKKVNEFLEDWRGEDARPGYPGRPGVLQRLVELERHAATTTHEVQPNSGSSMKDAINRIDSRTSVIPDVVSRLEALEAQQKVS